MKKKTLITIMIAIGTLNAPAAARAESVAICAGVTAHLSQTMQTAIAKAEEAKMEAQEAQEEAQRQIEEEKYYDELETLACCVEAEAANQGLKGKQYVVDVILNRVNSPDFPDTITGVIYQPHQFSVVSDGRINQVSPTEETYKAVTMELESRLNYDVLYFTAEGFTPYGTAYAKIGDHYFSTK